MDHTVCPGAKQLRQPKTEIFECPNCGEEVEIWSDEIKGNCPNCNTTVTRDGMNISCVEWCKYAKDCLGEDLVNQYMENKAVTLKEKLLQNLEEYFDGDTRRINHARKVLEYAEQLLKQEDADWHIIIPASILHDVGIKVAEQKYGSAEGKYQKKEGPAVAREMLMKLGLNMEDIEQICLIIRYHHSPGKVDTRNFRVLYDADSLVNIEEQMKGKPNDQREKIIEGIFLTEAGKRLAKNCYLK